MTSSKSNPKSTPSKKGEIKELSDSDWLLKRGHNVIGSLQPIQQSAYLYNPIDKKFEWQTYEFVPGLVKIINEILDNSIDVAIKSNFKYANEISIEITDNKIQVKDNGFGIPVKDSGNGVILPVIAWGRARAGSNFDDDEERTSIGMNGIGSFSTVVFSKKFVGITDDGSKRAKVTFKNNMESTDVEILDSSEQGTHVSFFPDLKRFGMETIDELHKALVFQRILNLSMLYPEIRFKYNKRLVKLDAKKFLGLFSDNFEFLEEDNYLIAVFNNQDADFNFHTYVNGLWLEKGGNHLNFITSKLTDDIRQKLIRKYKSMKPGDIKNKLSVVVFFRNFKNPKFDSQTKEFLTNTQKEITSFLSFNEPEFKKDWDKFIVRVYKDKSIIDPITDLYNAKMLIEEKKKLRDASKKGDDPEKYWPATDENKYLFLAEGDSAIGAITAELGRDTKGFFPLKGKPLNVLNATPAAISKNSEIKAIASILGIDLSSRDNKDLTYDNIVISPDMDVDGIHIAGLLLGMFATFTPDYLNQGKVFLFITPLITVLNSKKQLKFLFTMTEYDEFIKKYDPKGTKFIYDYKKGLGSMTDDEWKALFEQFKLEELLQPLHLKGSKNPEEELKELVSWLADDSDFRKTKILNKIRDFDINKV